MPYRLEIYIPPSPKFISRRPPPQSRSNPATSPHQLAQTLEAKAITRMANEYDSECRLFIWMLLVYQRSENRSTSVNPLDLGNVWDLKLSSLKSQPTSPKQFAQTLEAKAITQTANEYNSECILSIWILFVNQRIKKWSISANLLKIWNNLLCSQDLTQPPHISRGNRDNTNDKWIQ